MMPRPGRPVGTSCATLRSISESSGSPSRSSSRVPKMSRIAERKSAQRAAATSRCMPKVRPRWASACSSSSRSSKSARSVLQPSTTRNTSPYPSSARPSARRDAVGLDRVDALRAEVGLAAVHDALHLGHDAAYDVGLGAGADAGDVRQAVQRGERAAAEVEHVELALLRGRGHRQAGDHGAQQRALAAARAADDRRVAGRAGQRDRHRVAALLARTVDGAERDRQPAQAAPHRRDQAELRLLHEVGHQLVEGVGYVERRQPHLVGRRALADHPGDGDVEQRLLLTLLRRPGPAGDLVVGRLEGEHLGDRERQDAAQVAALVATYARPAGRRTGDVGGLELAAASTGPA